MREETYSLRSAQPLTEAYIHRTDDRLEALYGYHAGAEEDWERRAKRLQQSSHVRAEAAEVAGVLRVYNERAGAAPEVFASISAIAEGALVVVGGQQAGLWTGPLLVIHKAVSIIGAAKSASEQLGQTVVPVFWIAGEDHDWDEANHAYVISAEQELRKLSVARPEGARTSVSRTKLTGEDWATLLAELEKALPSSEFKPVMLEELRQMSQRADSLSDFFAMLLGHLFGKHGLVLLDSDHESIRRLEAPMFQRIIQRNNELEKAYASSAAQIKELDYELQAEVTPGSANLFFFHADNGNERTLLHKKDGVFQDRRGHLSLTETELLQIAIDEPQQLSNNVLTRPLMQDYLFPVLATVLGPGEIAYWALTGEAFRTLGMEMPIIVPRMSYTLIEGTVAKHMGKYELTFADVMERFEERKADWLKEQDGLSIEEQFADARDAFEQLYKPLLALATSVQPSLSKLGDTNLQKIVEQINYMGSKTVDAFNKQFEASTRQLDRIHLSILPLGKPQERVLNMAAYWNRYSLNWLDSLLDAPYSRTGGHEIVYL
ncbi:bacillithiol biosynthesis cysteine-adding enzyme BshC [Paenibacillus sp. FSL H8-0548]|uniref:bacillithiol biosynthesis cysteine-adding enzyme BshC n=1 Tax=Paenibacillus sp. FSL H8-0548 TaxID=1920422 RepID=UPI00096DB358|nr:bacillithiol biosynthesis cysteine-adding enzyme BshC [Paenibacillus sp. FSL H8-0548]OMF36966.1 bacillithiol biosynthesis cysteine-adding enzyme BshC [Paenibacillus sp. FSL H8-0548]